VLLLCFVCEGWDKVTMTLVPQLSNHPGVGYIFNDSWWEGI
jgi:hypothetical protein